MSSGDRSQTSAPLVGTLLGRYRLERQLGEGGMGVVYAARHQDLGRPAAVKVLNERFDSSDEVRTRFLREGQAAARIRHPNVVDVYDVGTEGGRAFLVMELLQGEDLRQLLDREKPLAPERAADLLVPVISALAAAHDLGVIHRDLKPDNIFLSVERNGLAPKVLDFGISKVIDEGKEASLTGTGTLLGTPYYMSPEQAQATKHVDTRSDQYSIGVILYECVTGRRPVEEPAIYQLIHRIVNGDFAPPRQSRPNLPSAFEQLILKTMAGYPADRFPNMRALGRALLPFASERIRVSYHAEFERDEAPVPPAPGTPATQDPALNTTLSESVHERESQRGRPPRWATGLTIGGAALLLLGFGVAFLRPDAKPSEPPAKAGAAAPVMQAAAAGMRPEEHVPSPDPGPSPKRLLSEPAGARVWIDGKDRGMTPLSVDVAPDTALAVELRLPGFEPHARELVAGDPAEVVITLLPAKAAEQPKSTRRSTRATARPELAPR